MANVILNGNEQTIWDSLYQLIQNDYGVAGMMGNLYAESHLYSAEMQNDFWHTIYSIYYTQQVDNGTITKNSFMKTNPIYVQPPNMPMKKFYKGYGLAQWTTTGRKENLYNYKVNNNYNSIGDLNMQLGYLKTELEGGYRSTLNILQNATSIAIASNEVLFHFEAPADQGTEKQLLRQDYSTQYYNMFSGGTPIPRPDPPPPDPPEPFPTYGSKGMPIYMYPIHSRFLH